MRHHPSCWNKVLAKLGFRRVPRHKRHAAFGARMSRIESLETRQMLAGNTYPVTTLEDVAVAGTTTDNLWSLREALAHSAADAQPGEDVIQFAELSGLIDLNPALGHLPVSREVKIEGPGADKLTIDARDASRVFVVNVGAVATISGLTITGGNANGASGYDGYGGGVFSDGALTLQSVDVIGNRALQYGGGVFNHSSGSLTIENSTFDDNDASMGGGGLSGHFNKPGLSLKISGSTFSNNRAPNAGGGAIWFNSNAGANASFEIKNSTFSGNQAKAGGAIYFQTNAGVTGAIVNSTIAYNNATVAEGGGIFNSLNNVQVTLHNTIVAKNTAVNGGYLDVFGALTIGSRHNFIGQQGGSGLAPNPTGTGSTGNWIGATANPIDPLLAPLGDYGGRTKTHALLPNSPAIDRGSDHYAVTVAGLTTDQRGFQRKVEISGSQNGIDGWVDIGAFELSVGAPESPTRVAQADFNGDSRKDDLLFDPLTGNVSVRLDSAGLNELQSWGTLSPVGGAASWTDFTVGDFTGDGRADFLVFNAIDHKWMLAVAESNVFHTISVGASATWTQRYVGDFDGDGADELIGRVDGASNWQLLEYDEETGARLRTNIGNPITAAGATFYVGDANRDGRDDLIGRVAGTPNVTPDVWYVGLSQLTPAGGGAFANSPTPNVWADWFNGHFNDNVLDVDGPYRVLTAAFADIYNNVELELYYGIKKGPDATIDSAGGSPWDQAVALVDRINATPNPYQATTVSGVITVPVATLGQWVGAIPNSSGAYSSDVVLKLVNALDPLASKEPGDKIKLNHAWVRVTLPDLGPIDLDPSWKFKDYQSGISLPADLDATDNHSLSRNHDLFDEYKFLSATVIPDAQSVFKILPESPIEFFEQEVQDHLVRQKTGKSIADISYDGPILTPVTTNLPIGLGAGVTINSQESQGTFEQIKESIDDRKAYMHRFRITLVRIPGNAMLWTYDLNFAEHANSPLLISTFGGGTSASSRLFVNGAEMIPSPSVGWADQSVTWADGHKFELSVEFFAPGDSIPEEPRTGTNDAGTLIALNELVAVGIGSNQFSDDRIAQLTDRVIDAAVLNGTGVDDINELIELGVAKVIHATRKDAKAVSAITQSAYDVQPSLVVMRAKNELLVHGNVQNMPFGFGPSDLKMTIPRASARFLKRDSGLRSAEISQLFVFQGSYYEHSVIEEISASEGGSTVKLLQRAFGGQQHSPGVRSQVQIVEKAVLGQTLYISVAGYLRLNPQSPNDPLIQTLPPEVLPQHPAFNPNLTDDQLYSTDYWQSIIEVPNIYSYNQTAKKAEIYFRLLRYFTPLIGVDSAENLANKLLRGDWQYPSIAMVPIGPVLSIGNWQGTGAFVLESTKNNSSGYYSAYVISGSDDPLEGGTYSGIPAATTSLPPAAATNVEVVAGDPVNVANGNMLRDERDIVFPNIGISLDFTRRYNSQSTRDTGFGTGWTHAFSDRLLLALDNQSTDSSNPDLIWYTTTGQEHVFRYDVANTRYKTPTSLHGTLTRSGTTLTFVDRDGIETRFEKAQLGVELHARITHKLDRNGDGYVVTYAASNTYAILAVEDVHTAELNVANDDAWDRKLVFHYDANGHIDSIKKFVDDGLMNGPDPLPVAVWTYAYETINAKQYLMTATAPGPAPMVTTYGYYTAAGPFQGLMRKITEPNGDWHEYEYYLNKRVFRVTTSADEEGERQTVAQTFNYNLVAGRTTFVNERDQSETFLFQRNGLVTDQIHADRTRLEYEWGKIGTPAEYLLASTQDEVGATESFVYYMPTGADNFSTTGHSYTTGVASNDVRIGQLRESKSKRFVNSIGQPIGVDGLVTQFEYSSPTAKPYIVNVSKITVNPGVNAIVTDFEYDNSTGQMKKAAGPGGVIERKYYANASDPALAYQNGLLESEITANGFSDNKKPLAWLTLKSAGTSLDYVEVNSGTIGTISVRLSGDTVGGNYIADSVRVERIGAVGGANDGLYDSRIVDNSDAANFAVIGTGTPASIGAQTDVARYQSSAVTIATGQSAVWTFKNLEPGRYRIVVNVLPSAAGVADGVYRVYDAEFNPAGNQTPLITTAAIDHSLGGTFFDHQTRFTYDTAGNVKQTQLEMLTQSLSTYDHNGRLLTAADGAKFDVHSTYDILGRRRTSGLANINDAGAVLSALQTSYGYDLSDQLTSTTDPTGAKATFTHDLRGNVVQRTNHDGSTATFEYDEMENLVASTNELGETTRFVYDVRDRLIQTIHPDGKIEQLRYDGVGRISASIDALGRKTEFVYDAAGRLKKTISPDPDGPAPTLTSPITVNKYDVLGHLVETVDAKGVVTQFKYDQAGRLIRSQALSSADPAVVGAATQEAAVTATKPPVYLATRDYDNRGNVVREVTYDILTLVRNNASYVLPGDLTTISNDYKHVVEYVYDSFDHLVKQVVKGGAVSVGQDVAARTLYDLAGRVRLQFDELGRRTEFEYDVYGRLINTVLPDPDGAAPAKVSPEVTRTYDAAGRVLTESVDGLLQSSNRYDSLGRLIATANGAGEEVRYVYDAAGQLIATIDPLGRASYAKYDSRGRVKTQRAADPDGAGPLTAPATHYEYDDAGNVIAVVAPNGYRTKFVYDNLNRLVKEISTDVQVADNYGVGALNADMSLPINSEGSFGRDYTIATPFSGAPLARWGSGNTLATNQQYQVAMTWDGASGLDAAASVQVKIYPRGSGTPSSTVTFTRDQTTDLWLDDGGRWRDWRNLGTFTIPASGRIEITVTGHAGTPLRVDAVMFQRTIERNYSYDAHGNLETETDSLGRTTSYVYDELRRLTKTTLPDPDGPTGDEWPYVSNLQSPITDQVYDGYGNVVQIIERRGSLTDRKTDFQYDKRNRLVMETALPGNSLQVSTKYEYDDAGNLQSLLEAYGSIDEVVTEYDYDALDRLTDELQDAGRISSPNSRPTTRHHTKYGYDSVGNLIRTELIITDPATQNSPSPVSASTVSTSTYDRANRLVETVSGVGAQTYHPNATTRYSYDAAGNLLTERDATGRVTGYAYDRLNRVIKSTLPDPDLVGQGAAAPFTTYSYDVLGNVLSTTNSLGEASHRIYDALGRQISGIDSEGKKSRTRYDSEGNVAIFTDPSGNVTDYVYDDLNRLKQETIYISNSPQSRSYFYDDAGLLATTLDRNGRVQKFANDDLDRIIMETWYDDVADTNFELSIVHGYDKLSRPISHVQSNSSFVVQYAEADYYDNLGRIVQHDNYEGGSARPNPRVKQLYQYDVINLSDPASPFQTIYTQSVEDSVGGPYNADAVTTYSMDLLGRTKRIYDDVANANELSPGKSDKTIDFTYDAAGRMKSIARSSVAGSFQLNTSYDYDGVGRLKKIDYTRLSIGTIAAFDYQYDAASRLTDVDEFFGLSSASVNFKRDTDLFYDIAGRLITRATAPRSGHVNGFAVVDAFTLDATGNRKTTSVDGVSKTNTITPNNRLANDGVYAYTYDNEGNLISKTLLVALVANGEQTVYTWDHRNRLTKVTRNATPGGAELERVEYRYDANDLRVRREVFAGGSSTPATTEHFVNDGDHVAMVLSAAGKVQHRYLYGPGTDALLVDEVFNSSGQAERGYWTVADHLGTIHELIESDADGTPADNHKLVEHRDYDASGKLARVVNGAAAAVAVDNLASDFAFAGREWDGDAALYYNRARWLDAQTGRFISEDPIGFAGGDANLYRYAYGDPANSRDPSGLSPAITFNVGNLSSIWQQIPLTIPNVTLESVKLVPLPTVGPSDNDVHGLHYDPMVVPVGGHHPIPTETWPSTGLGPAATDIWDSPEVRINQPEGTGHNYRGHGSTTGYSAEVSRLLEQDLANYRTAQTGSPNGKLSQAQEAEFARKFLAKIIAMPKSSYIGGFNNAVRDGGKAAVRAWLAANYPKGLSTPSATATVTPPVAEPTVKPSVSGPPQPSTGARSPASNVSGRVSGVRPHIAPMAIGGAAQITRVASMARDEMIARQGIQFGPWEFADEGGKFVVEYWNQYRIPFWIKGQKRYIEGEKDGQVVPMTGSEVLEYKREGEKRWGYIDWKGQFVPGTERKSLPVNNNPIVI